MHLSPIQDRIRPAEQLSVSRACPHPRHVVHFREAPRPSPVTPEARRDRGGADLDYTVRLRAESRAPRVAVLPAPNSMQESDAESAMDAAFQRLQPTLRQLMKRMSGAWTGYQNALAAEPLKTKALTSLTGLVIADVLAQATQPGSFDPMRTVRMGAFGVAIHGPLGHYWYRLLDRTVMPKTPGATMAIVGKMVTDQAVFAPICTGIFYASLAVMEGRPGAIPEILQNKWLTTVLAGYLLWPAAHIVNFKYVKSEHRLLYINVVNLFWTIYLSILANTPVIPMDDAKHMQAVIEPPLSETYTTIPIAQGPQQLTPPPPRDV